MPKTFWISSTVKHNLWYWFAFQYVFQPVTKGCFSENQNIKNKDILFNGLSAVVSTLCELDGSKNIMDCSALFDFKSQELELQY